jgi:hypothetical protein
MQSQAPLGIIAGQGQFPFLVVQGAKRAGRKTVAVGFREHTRPELYAVVDRMMWLRLGQLGKMLSFFKKNGVEEVVFAGGIDKPKALQIIPDFRAALLLLQSRSKNDNAILHSVVRLLEREGLKVASPIDYVPGLLTPEGVMGKRRPDKREQKDIQFGWPLAKELGRMDIGQCLVVKDQMVVAVEAMEGTNATIERAGNLAGPGCVVLKVFKPGQESNVDQPSIGKDTIEVMRLAGASCLAVEAGRSLFFDREQAVRLADEHGIAVVGKSAEPSEAQWQVAESAEE